MNKFDLLDVRRLQNDVRYNDVQNTAWKSVYRLE